MAIQEDIRSVRTDGYFRNEPAEGHRQSRREEQISASPGLFPDQNQHQRQLVSLSQDQQNQKQQIVPFPLSQDHQQTQNQQALPSSHGFLHDSVVAANNIVAAPPLVASASLPLPPEASAGIPQDWLSHERLAADPNVFYAALRNIHGANFKIPTYNDVQLDLHRLYVEVTSRGGLAQVIRNRKLDEITAAFKLPLNDLPRKLRTDYLKFLKIVEEMYFKSQNQSTVNSSTSLKLQKPSSEIKRGRKRKSPLGEAKEGDPSSSPKQTFMGVIDGKFEHGYFVTVKHGSDIFRGVFYEVGHEGSSPCNTVNSWNPSASGGRTQRRRKERTWKRDPNHPKPNRSGYNFFFADQHARIKASNAEEDKEFSKTIGAMWNKLSNEDKAVYQVLGKKDKERYQKELQEYKAKLSATASSNSATSQQSCGMSLSSTSASHLSTKIEPSNLNFQTESISAQSRDLTSWPGLNGAKHGNSQKKLINEQSSSDARVRNTSTQSSYVNDSMDQRLQTLEIVPHENINELGGFNSKLENDSALSRHINTSLEPSNLDVKSESISAQSTDVTPMTELQGSKHENSREKFLNEQSGFDAKVENISTQSSHGNDPTEQALVELTTIHHENIDESDGFNAKTENNSARSTDVHTSSEPNSLNHGNAGDKVDNPSDVVQV